MGGLLTGPTSDSFKGLFIPSVCLLIAFLGYTSQWLFNTTEYLEPGPMTKRETTIFNILLVCIWSTYYKACTVPPGRYHFPDPDKLDKPNPSSTDKPSSSSSSFSTTEPPINQALPARWCKKCASPKPLRAHHCRHCGTCIPKMDHHCPWTANCVSLQTFPHFFRFLLYTNLTLAYLHAALLYPRFRFLFWDNSRLPAYLGPSVPAIIHLTLLGLLGGLTSIALAVLLITTLRGWVLNQTMIEGWEMERHDAVLARAKKAGGYWSSSASSSTGLRISRVEFPYDIDFFANMAQAMGMRNVLAWLDPFVGSNPVVSRTVGKGVGWEWEENGFNDREGMWPPIDPDKMRRGVKNPQWAEQQRQEIQNLEDKWQNPEGEIAAFRARQEMDLRRRRGESGVIAELDGDQDLDDLEYEYIDDDCGSGEGYDEYDDQEDGVEEDSSLPGKPYFEQGFDGEPGWTNAEGDRLRDYGVDEDAEDSDDDVPLGELLRRRKAYGSVET